MVCIGIRFYCGGGGWKLWWEIMVGNYGGKLWWEIMVGNYGGKLW
jgi:hypothetical protein